LDRSAFNPLPQERQKVDVPEKRNRQLAQIGRRRKTAAEIQAEAEQYVNNQGRAKR
jgi:hypothetical protein